MNVVSLGQSHYWKTFSKSEKRFFWFFNFGVVALTYFLMKIILSAFK